MRLFERFRRTTNEITVEQLIDLEYTQVYFEECRYIWKTYAPKNGQSDVLQGELLKELEKLRGEAQGNGNINWDEDFIYFCEFIRKTLCSRDIISDAEKEKITLALTHIKNCGNYARLFNSGEISERELDINMIAYTKDNLYDIVADAIGFLQSKVKEPIPYKHNETIKR